jgi:REP element-mobilizing transposase RayT
LFGEIKNGEMKLNDAGKMISNAWAEIPSIYDGFDNDLFIVMPNHMHCILVKAASAGPAQRPAPTLGLPELMRNFKSITTLHYIRGVKENAFEGFDKKLWQRSYYEHIIRDERSLNNIRQYIINNPAKWDEDRENPLWSPPNPNAPNR